MSDHEVSKPAQAHDVDDAVAAAPEADAQGAAETADTAPRTDVPAAAEASASHEPVEETAPAAQPDHAAVAQSANESLAEAERAAADATAPAPEHAAVQKSAAEKPAVDPELAAFEEAEAAYPGTFGGTFTPPPAVRPAEVVEETVAIDAATTRVDTADDARTQVLAPPPAAVATAAVDAPPIFVQAPEAPRERGNRGAIFGIGLLAAIAFAILYLGTTLGIAAFEGNISTTDGFVPVLLDHLKSAGLWVPVAAFAIGFWILGGIINRGRWGFWVVFGIIVGAFAYGGHVLGAIGSVEFWKLGGSELAGLANAQLLSPLAIAAFIFGRELTIWFGAWAARTGARRTAQNEEAQREYERVLEAGPQLP
ncbi:hypothetical protein [Microbacterium azadirachtae]|uniref:hypothetical protein n=1 Tax=Microbacterium azadirachtae TaxID=582680 RepID=UPI0008906A1D|nr:hypothetical protein [Microbacterium azadirachtae]SDM44705.1 hypothetical protein SAMN04488593_3582 [Microbacterium azadirachtae]SEG56397.1 hypothetical protein SAMN04488594_3507 [Microbacterium azadirachtae]SEG59229.1 hypothetical protein SAMN04488592_3518 [Microbacterium azadirachtae]